VPNRWQPRRILLPRTEAQPYWRDRVESIATRRDQLISEVKKLREECELASPSIETVRRLLIRSWGRANWRARAQLIKAADWLIPYRQEIESIGKDVDLCMLGVGVSDLTR
jgi:hypothetical protein